MLSDRTVWLKDAALQQPADRLCPGVLDHCENVILIKDEWHLQMEENNGDPLLISIFIWNYKEPNLLYTFIVFHCMTSIMRNLNDQFQTPLNQNVSLFNSSF